MKKSVREAASALRDRLKGEGRHRDAQIIQDVLRSSDSGRTVNSQLHATIRKLKERPEMTDYRDPTFFSFRPLGTPDEEAKATAEMGEMMKRHGATHTRLTRVGDGYFDATGEPWPNIEQGLYMEGWEGTPGQGLERPFPYSFPFVAKRD